MYVRSMKWNGMKWNGKREGSDRVVTVVTVVWFGDLQKKKRKKKRRKKREQWCFHVFDVFLSYKI